MLTCKYKGRHYATLRITNVTLRMLLRLKTIPLQFFSGHRKPTRAIRLYKNTASKLINKALMVGVNCVEFIFIPIINVSPPNI